jgi:hypothetical protein
MTNSNFTPGPLPILLSCRVRLDDEQRATLKLAYARAKAGYEAPQGARIGGSAVTTVTSTNIDSKLGIPSVVMSDLLSSRDSIALTVVLKIQRTLGVEVITKDDILKAAKGYVDYVYSSVD